MGLARDTAGFDGCAALLRDAPGASGVFALAGGFALRTAGLGRGEEARAGFLAAVSGVAAERAVAAAAAGLPGDCPGAAGVEGPPGAAARRAALLRAEERWGRVRGRLDRTPALAGSALEEFRFSLGPLISTSLLKPARQADRDPLRYHRQGVTIRARTTAVGCNVARGGAVSLARGCSRPAPLRPKGLSGCHRRKKWKHECQ